MIVEVVFAVFLYLLHLINMLVTTLVLLFGLLLIILVRLAYPDSHRVHEIMLGAVLTFRISETFHGQTFNILAVCVILLHS